MDSWEAVGVMRKKMVWLEGFAAALERKDLKNFVNDFNHLLNSIETELGSGTPHAT